MSHQVRLDDDVYERIKANKRDDESFSDAVERLIGGRSLRELRAIFDEEQVSEMETPSKPPTERIETKSAKSRSASNNRQYKFRPGHPLTTLLQLSRKSKNLNPRTSLLSSQ